jgi:hypothetical protein
MREHDQVGWKLAHDIVDNGVAGVLLAQVISDAASLAIHGRDGKGWLLKRQPFDDFRHQR